MKRDRTQSPLSRAVRSGEGRSGLRRAAERCGAAVCGVSRLECGLCGAWVSWVGSMDLHGPEISRAFAPAPRFRAFGAKARGFGFRSKISRIVPLPRYYALLTVLGPRRAVPACRIKRRTHHRHINRSQNARSMAHSLLTPVCEYSHHIRKLKSHMR